MCFTDLDFVKRYTKLFSLLCETSRLGDYLPDRQNRISIFYSSGRQTFSLESYVTSILISRSALGLYLLLPLFTWII
jgi:hypothetical protein